MLTFFFSNVLEIIANGLQGGKNNQTPQNGLDHILSWYKPTQLSFLYQLRSLGTAAFIFSFAIKERYWDEFCSKWHHKSAGSKECIGRGCWAWGPTGTSSQASGSRRCIQGNGLAFCLLFLSNGPCSSEWKEEKWGKCMSIVCSIRKLLPHPWRCSRAGWMGSLI